MTLLQLNYDATHLEVRSIDLHFKNIHLFHLQVVCNKSRETKITMLQCTNARGRTKGATERFIVFVHQHHGDNVTIKPLISMIR